MSSLGVKNSVYFHSIKETYATSLRNMLSEKSFDSTQFAYTKWIGTIDALVKAVTSWKMSMDNKKTLAVHALFEDFSKEFDNMRPDVLAAIMDQQGYDQTIITLCIDYLTNRKQRVIHKPSRSVSSERSCSVGVPQGTICGPVLWNIFIKSLESSENILKYADDLTIYATIPKSAVISGRRGEKTTDNAIIAAEAEATAKWCEEHGMTLNTSKTKHMLISLRDNIILEQPVIINGAEIERVPILSYLVSRWMYI